MPASTRLARAIVIGLASVPTVALAGTFDYTLYGGLEHSNNIALSSDRPLSETVLSPGATFQFYQLGSTFQANVGGTLQYNKYLENRFDSQTQTQVSGQANWTVMPDRLDFSVEDYAGIQPVDQLSSDSPDNQQQTNVIVLGPTLRMRFGDAARGQFELRYINSYASKVDEFDSSRGMAAFRLYRDLSPTDVISGNVEFQRVDFDKQPSSANYDRKEAYVRYTSKLARFDADVLVGGTRISFDGGRNTDAPLVRMQIGWLPTLRNALTVSGVYQYADAAQDIITTPGVYGPSLGADRVEAIDPFANTGGLGRGLTGAGIGVGDAVIGAEIYKERRLEATWNWRGERLNITVAPYSDRLRYLEDNTFDRTSRGVSIGVGYKLTPTMTLAGFGTGEHMDYQQLNRTDKTIRLGLDLSQQVNRHWTWHVGVARNHRNSNAADQSYSENQIFVGLVFRR
ncbi:MAG: outer membrane beta-barrel protein [Luteibacter sp.]